MLERTRTKMLNSLLVFLTSLIEPLTKLGGFILAYYKGVSDVKKKQAENEIDYAKDSNRLKDNISSKSRHSIVEWMRKR